MPLLATIVLCAKLKLARAKNIF